MAKFKFNGVDSISASFDELARLSDEEKLSILRPSAELLAGRFVETLKSLFKQRSGSLAGSVSTNERVAGGEPMIHIYLKGKHPGSSTGRRRPNGKSKGKYSGTNEEIGYILEYGSPRIAATHWMENTNENSADDVTAAQQEAWNDLLTKKGL